MVTDVHARRLVLWDIDHTLIETRGLGSRLSAAAFRTVTGRILEHEVDPTGRTEQAIIAETLQRHGIQPTDGLRQRYAVELAREYAEHIELLRATGRALDGAAVALATLAGRPDVIQTVLTGNLRAVAMTKLQAFALDQYIDFEVGAYGEDAVERAELVPVAQARAGQRYRGRFDATNTVIVGDTGQDVAAAHQGGAHVIAVASGRESIDQLQTAGADAVLADLRDTRRLSKAIEAACT